jgi:hypothetical protein
MNEARLAISKRLDKRLHGHISGLDSVLLFCDSTLNQPKQVLFKSEDVMQQRSPRIAWFRSVKNLQERNAKTVEPSVTVAAPIAINAK